MSAPKKILTTEVVMYLAVSLNEKELRLIPTSSHTLEMNILLGELQKPRVIITIRQERDIITHL